MCPPPHQPDRGVAVARRRTPDILQPIVEDTSALKTQRAGDKHPLQVFWALGKQSKVRRDAAEARGKLGYGAKAEWLAAEGKRMNLNHDLVPKAWRVADEYTGHEIDGLVKLAGKHRSGFGPSHLVKLLSVRNRKKRDRLAVAAIEGGWSSTEVVRQIQARQPRRKGVGRRPKVPAGEKALLSKLVSVSEAWERWAAAAAARLPDDVYRAVHAATAAVGRAKTVAEAKLPMAKAENKTKRG